MAATDRRESGYCRVAIKKSEIKPLGLKALPSGTYWIYAQRSNNIEKPSAQYPITQSYVDIFMNGCIQIGRTFQIKNFAEKCITTTSTWPSPKENKAWINDRQYPRRPFGTPNAFQIDTLLAKAFNNYYQHPYDE